MIEQHREHRLHLLFLSPYPDELDMCEFLLIARFYHLCEEVVDYLPWLVCFHGISTKQLKLFQRCALARENLEDVGRQMCDFLAVCESKYKSLEGSCVDYLSE